MIFGYSGGRPVPQAKRGPVSTPQAMPETSTLSALRAHAGPQPYDYPPQIDFIEPDWTRLPGYAGVSGSEWRSAKWQRQHTVKNLDQLRRVYGDLLPEVVYQDIARDQQERSTMSMLIPPQMLNTIDESAFAADPIRRYMIPMFSDRATEFPSHPFAERDSLHEADMWAVEGLTHRYPTKVLAELLATCPQYCGHCTRMDLVGNNVPQVLKHRFEIKNKERYESILEYLRGTPSVRDVVVSGGDIANLPIHQLEDFLVRLVEIPNIRDVRLATKGLMGLPQHFLQDEVLFGLERIAHKALEHEVDMAVHVHINHARSVTPLVAEVTKKMHSMGFRDVRNQGVLLRGVNDSPRALLDLAFMLQDKAKILPYYFYMCDMIPNSEHWRLSVFEAQELQHAIMGYLPGFATPRIVCDVPFVGKRWVHQLDEYDRVKGISYWTKNYRTGIEYDDPDALTKRYPYYDPIYTLPPEGQEHWRSEMSKRRSA